MDNLLQHIKRFIPRRIFSFFQPYYHHLLSVLAAYYYRFPSRQLTVIAVTGTKGKSSTTEIITHLLEQQGYRVASLSTIQFKIGEQVERNLFKMTTPGRFFVQHFLRRAVTAECTHAVIEMSSEAVKLYRHLYIDFDALVFTNLSPEHIESHGSFTNYKAAKLKLAAALARSKKQPRYIVANIDDEHGADFLDFPVENQLPYSLKDLSLYTLQKDGFSMILDGQTFRVPLLGLFNVYNTLAAVTLVRALGLDLKTIEAGLRTLPTIKGRVELLKSPESAPKKITAVIDYAHTVDSLTKVYEAFPDTHKICLIGNTGGGRDTWKRPEMAAVAEKYCDYIIFTNEDPYDESPYDIIDAMIKGLSKDARYEIIMDRRAAINKALQLAPDNSYVMITGKGTDPYIMGANNTKEPWSDLEVTREEMANLWQKPLA